MTLYALWCECSEVAVPYQNGFGALCLKHGFLPFCFCFTACLDRCVAQMPFKDFRQLHDALSIPVLAMP
jgi:hypothetical protein